MYTRTLSMTASSPLAVPPPLEGILTLFELCA